MIRRIPNILTATSLAFVTVVVILAAPSFFAPEFEVANRSSEPVSVIVEWRDDRKRVGRIEPGASSRFGIDDEAAMKFWVRYANGDEFESEAIYFTRGVTVIANISGDGVDVRYGHEG